LPGEIENVSSTIHLRAGGFELEEQPRLAYPGSAMAASDLPAPPWRTPAASL